MTSAEANYHRLRIIARLLGVVALVLLLAAGGLAWWVHDFGRDINRQRKDAAVQRDGNRELLCDISDAVHANGHTTALCRVAPR